MSVSFDGKVAIVTGSGNGLGRSHALAIAARGAKVVVNDLGGDRNGIGSSNEAAREVVATIEAAGGEAIASEANVADYAEVESMVDQAMDKWGRVDILINNAGILRDKSFAKMDLDDFRLVMDVHLMGSVNCCKAVWEIMKEQNYGRIVMTTSPSGLFGNFGQTNYGAAKMAVIGLMNTLVLEGSKYNIQINALAPTAGTRMTEDIIPPPVLKLMTTEAVTAGALILCHDEAPNKMILAASAGGYASVKMFETDGIFLSPAEQRPENVFENLNSINDTAINVPLESAGKETEKFVSKAMAYVQSLQSSQ